MPRRPVLPPIDATPEEIAKSLFPPARTSRTEPEEKDRTDATQQRKPRK